MYKKNYGNKALFRPHIITSDKIWSEIKTYSAN